jgi:hypothetical protein
MHKNRFLTACQRTSRHLAQNDVHVVLKTPAASQRVLPAALCSSAEGVGGFLVLGFDAATRSYWPDVNETGA